MDIKHLVERSLYFIVDNSHLVIQVTIFVIIVLVVLYLFNLIVSGNESSEGLSKKDITALETRIKTVLEQASTVTSKPKADIKAGAETSEAGTEDVEQVTASKEVLEQIETLKKEVEQKETELNELKESGSMGGGISEEESKNYMDKINELEAKLQEYEIIEDEIADLSHFKEENERLKKQLEEIQQGGDAPDAVAEETQTEEQTSETEKQQPAPEESKQDPPESTTEESSKAEAEPKDEDKSEGTSDDLMAQASAMLGDQAEEESAKAEEPIVEESKQEEKPNDDQAKAEAEVMLSGNDQEEEEFITKDFIEDFDKAVKEDVYGITEEDSVPNKEDKGKQQQPEAANAEPIKEESQSQDQRSEESSEQDKSQQGKSTEESSSEQDTNDDGEDSEDQGLVTDDLLAEFSQQLEPEMNAQVEETEKQAKEASAEDAALIDTEKMMQEMEELKELPEEETSISALEEDTDIEKMANEATKLSSES